ncbi:ScbA/BarX family gamma-butyrolactone biosynthesis protein [Streptomyces sp. NPDC002619]|uniref:ScbA/BarX family gamma-butyrolactone biosynthesis protein n=1 Tax=Streptomyces sp. NPDC002619 TaxID=3364655 RepID=UPI0036BA5B27
MTLSAPSDVGLPALPRLTTTVPREYVHRACLAEVFLTGCTAHGNLRFTLTGQWPRAHALFNSPDGTRHDPLQIAETFRQAGMFVSHAELGIPLDHHFVMWSLSYTSDLRQLAIASTPTDFRLEVKCTQVNERRGLASQARMAFTIHRSGNLMAHGAAHYTVITPSAYARLRADRLDPHPFNTTAPRTQPATAPIPPALVGRTSPTDVVLTPTEKPNQWLLTPDFNHPILFDHHADHLPGMVLLEGARQAATASVGPRTLTPASTSTDFHHYAELDQPCWIEATRTTPESGGNMTIEVTGRQNSKTIFTSTITGPAS